MQVAFFSNCDCDSVTVATRFFTFLPFYLFTLLLFYPFTFLPFYLFTLLPFLGNRLKFFSCV